MAELSGFANAGTGSPEKIVAIIRVGEMNAEYSTGRRANGEWFALANVSPAPQVAVGPARLVIGLGNSAEEAMQRMTARIKT